MYPKYEERNLEFLNEKVVLKIQEIYKNESYSKLLKIDYDPTNMDKEKKIEIENSNKQLLNDNKFLEKINDLKLLIRRKSFVTIDDNKFVFN